jgi:hypothetical protein
MPGPVSDFTSQPHREPRPQGLRPSCSDHLTLPLMGPLRLEEDASSTVPLAPLEGLGSVAWVLRAPRSTTPRVPQPPGGGARVCESDRAEALASATSRATAIATRSPVLPLGTIGSARTAERDGVHCCSRVKASVGPAGA